MPLFDSERWVKNYEKGLKEAWRLHIQLKTEQDIEVRNLK